MNTAEKHPDVVPYAQGDLPAERRAEIEEHLTNCAECRDLVLFIRKTNATLVYEGRVSRVAKALGISVEQLNQEIRRGTSIAAVVENPPVHQQQVSFSKK
jgi:anti-sigma factor RsiW